MLNRIPCAQRPAPMPKDSRKASAFRPCHETFLRTQQIPHAKAKYEKFGRTI